MRISIRFLTQSALIAAIYALFTLLCYPLAYGAVQFRLSEVMVLLAFVDRRYIPGLLVGCFVANLLGIGGIIDAVFGTLASQVSLLFVHWSARWFKNQTLGLYVASLWPSIFSFIIAFEMVVILRDTQSFLFWMGMVALGEFCVVTIVGVPLMRLLLSRAQSAAWLHRIREES